MNTNRMQAIRSRAVTTARVFAIATVFAFAGPPADTTAPVSAQAVSLKQRVIQVGQFRTCLFVCLPDGLCCTQKGQL